jgi:CheY-like chemotaxis protein
VHRDVKPSNIMLMASGAAKLLDLGLAQRFLTAEEDEGESEEGLRGTPLYMAPEQFLNPCKVNFRSDMFALGITLYEALVGQPPFDSRSVSELIFRREEQAVTPPHERVSGIPCALSELIMELLRSDPERRPRGYDVIVSRLRVMLEHVGAVAEGAGDVDESAQEGEESASGQRDTEFRDGEGFDARHILLVEDSLVNQLLIRRMLGELRFNVSVASDGLEALEQVRKTRFGAILMDCELPRMNGYAATRLVRALESRGVHRTPIIALTANILPGDRRRAQVAGMDDFLTKPVSRDRLEATLIHWQRRLGIC